MKIQTHSKTNRIKHGMKLNRKFSLVMLLLVLVPTVIFIAFIYGSMVKNTIEENTATFNYYVNRSYDEILKKVEIVNAARDYALTDSNLLGLIKFAYNDIEYFDSSVSHFYTENMVSLQRMVESNPDIYKLRVYFNSQTITEMEPIVYNHDTLTILPWYKEKNEDFWTFNYIDTNTKSTLLNASQRNVAHITPLIKEGIVVGYMEVATTMNTMFPDIYSTDDKMVLFFKANDGHYYCSDQNRYFVKKLRTFLEEDENWNWFEDKAPFTPDYEDEVLVTTKYIPELDGSIVGVYKMEEALGRLKANRNMYLMVMLIIAVILAWSINYIVYGLLRQFYTILKSIREVQKGNLDVRIEGLKNDEVGELGEQINKMLDRITLLLQENVTRERLAKNSEIRVLQNQINAHFIYNVLESIKMMAEIDEKYDISDAVTSLGRLLRYSMHWTSATVTVEEELEYVKNYLALINLRFDYEIYLSLNIKDIVLKQEIPKMSLQPIVENAIYHGIEQIAEDTNIYVKGKVENRKVFIEITDAGKGMSEEQIAELMKKINGELNADEIERKNISREGGGNGIGLKNVQDRIHMNFGEEYGLTINSKPGLYTKVEICVPQTYFESND